MPTSTDTFQRIDPVTKQVAIEVEGRLKAQGVDFISNSPAADPDPQSQIRWKRENGLWIAYIEAYRQPAPVPGGTESSTMRIGAKTGGTTGDNEESRLTFSRTAYADGTFESNIIALCGGGMPSSPTSLRKILDNTGKSDFDLEAATSAAVATTFGQIPGPWPVSINIPLNGGNYVVGVFGTAMKQGAGGMIFLDVTWNGVNKGALQQWNSTINEHTTLNPLFFTLPNLGFNTYTLSIAHGGGAGVTWSNADSRLTYVIIGNK